jgi:hypothetical protein
MQFLATDLLTFLKTLKDNKIVHLLLVILVCIVIYYLASKYISLSRKKNNFSNILIGTIYGSDNRCSDDIPKMNEALIRNMINLPNRNSKYLTSSMVIPEQKVNEELRRKTRMDILNMFYNSFDDDVVSYNSRPKGLYVIP